MDSINLKILKGRIKRKEDTNKILVYYLETSEGIKKINSYHYDKADLFLSEYKDEEFYIITDDLKPLVLRSFDGNTVFVLNLDELVDNDIYIFNRYRLSRDKLMDLVKEEFNEKKLERRK